MVGSDMILDGPREPAIRDESTYRELLEEIGFTQIEIIDTLDFCAAAFRTRYLAFLWLKSQSGEVCQNTVDEAMRLGPGSGEPAKRYWIISARRPGELPGSME